MNRTLVNHLVIFTIYSECCIETGMDSVDEREASQSMLKLRLSYKLSILDPKFVHKSWFKNDKLFLKTTNLGICPFIFIVC